MLTATGKITQAEVEHIEFDKARAAFGASAPLIIGKYLCQIHEEKFADVIRDCLYQGATEDSKLLQAIKKLALPLRHGTGLDSIITFNFDDLVERALGAAEINHVSVHDEEIRVPSSYLPIYHVHGYIPKVRSTKVTSNIVFSEDAYHRQFGDPFSWSNIVQLLKYNSKTCVFVGLSFNDPNLRRLLDASSSRKGASPATAPNDHFHYAIQRKANGSPDSSLIDKLRETDAELFGIKILWVDDYTEIPDILSNITHHEAD